MYLRAPTCASTHTCYRSKPADTPELRASRHQLRHVGCPAHSHHLLSNRAKPRLQHFPTHCLQKTFDNQATQRFRLVVYCPSAALIDKPLPPFMPSPSPHSSLTLPHFEHYFSSQAIAKPGHRVGLKLMPCLAPSLIAHAGNQLAELLQLRRPDVYRNLQATGLDGWPAASTDLLVKAL